MKDEERAELIIKIVSEYFEISDEELRYANRRKCYNPRKITIDLITNETRLSKARIGSHFDLNHYSIPLASLKLKELNSVDKILRDNTQNIERIYLKKRNEFVQEIVEVIL